VVLHNVGYGVMTTDGNSINNRDEVSRSYFFTPPVRSISDASH
jgi:hypothetical protein